MRARFVMMNFDSSAYKKHGCCCEIIALTFIERDRFVDRPRISEPASQQLFVIVSRPENRSQRLFSRLTETKLYGKPRVEERPKLIFWNLALSAYVLSVEFAL